MVMVNKLNYFQNLLSALVIISIILMIGLGRYDSSDYSVKIDDRPVISLDTRDEKTEIILTGDVMLGRSVMSKALELNDNIYPFRKVAGTLRNADIVFINLENPIIDNCPKHESGFKFCSTPFMVEGLVFAGVDIVTLANNHSRNYGEDGIKQTKEFLEKNAISVTGLNNLAVKQYNNVTFGFLGFDFVVREPTANDYQLIKESKEKVDLLIVAVHWGVEYTDQPTQRQKLWAEKLIDSGSDVIVGHHPHWVQIVEQVKSKPVYYSLGNFVFDQMWGERTRRGLIVRLTFSGKDMIKEELLPIYMSSLAQPSFVSN